MCYSSQKQPKFKEYNKGGENYRIFGMNEGIRMTQGNWESKLSSGLKEVCSTKQNGNCQVILELISINGEDSETLIRSVGGKVIRKVELLSGVAVDVPFNVIESLAQSEHVKRIWLDSKTRIC